MLLLVGLGNPGAEYKHNRHNIGFQCIDAIAVQQEFGAAKQKCRGLLREGYLSCQGQRRKALLLKPQTFYNEAGQSIAEIVRYYKIPVHNITIFHDEIDLAPGKIKIKRGGGAAGNNGLKSAIAHLGPDFQRVRIGVGHPGDKSRVSAYVLGDFPKDDYTQWVTGLVDACARAVPFLALEGDQAGEKFLSSVIAMLTPPRSARTRVLDSDQHRNKHKISPRTTSDEKTKRAPSPFAAALKEGLEQTGEETNEKG